MEILGILFGLWIAAMGAFWFNRASTDPDLSSRYFYPGTRALLQAIGIVAMIIGIGLSIIAWRALI